jgi:hypothetical protein
MGRSCQSKVHRRSSFDCSWYNFQPDSPTGRVRDGICFGMRGLFIKISEERVGGFYVSFAVHGASQAGLTDSLKELKCRGFVSKDVEGINVFYEEKADSQDEDVILAVGTRVSKAVGKQVLAVLNHDDSVLMYWLFKAGKVVDTYNSAPGYFNDEDNTPVGGDTKKLCKAFATKEAGELIREILTSEDYVFAVERHEALAVALGMDPRFACLGFEAINGGEFPAGVTKKDFVKAK